MSEEPTNGELAVMIKGIREVMDLQFAQNNKDHNAVNSHLKTLNGQVIRNTKFRTRWSGAYIVITVLATLAAVWSNLKNLLS